MILACLTSSYSTSTLFSQRVILEADSSQDLVELWQRYLKICHNDSFIVWGVPFFNWETEKNDTATVELDDLQFLEPTAFFSFYKHRKPSLLEFTRFVKWVRINDQKTIRRKD